MLVWLLTVGVAWPTWLGLWCWVCCGTPLPVVRLWKGAGVRRVGVSREVSNEHYAERRYGLSTGSVAGFRVQPRESCHARQVCCRRVQAVDPV